MQHRLVGGALDVAVLVTSNRRDRAALTVEMLEVSPFRLWLPLDHRPSAGEEISVAAEPLIMLPVGEIEENAARLLAAVGTWPNAAFRTRSAEAERSLVANGAGVAPLPDLVHRPLTLQGDQIEICDVSGQVSAVQAGLASRRGAPLSEIGCDFVRTARAYRGQRQRRSSGFPV